jgi:hypothetical protein
MGMAKGVLQPQLHLSLDKLGSKGAELRMASNTMISSAWRIQVVIHVDREVGDLAQTTVPQDGSTITSQRSVFKIGLHNHTTNPRRQNNPTAFLGDVLRVQKDTSINDPVKDVGLGNNRGTHLIVRMSLGINSLEDVLLNGDLGVHRSIVGSFIDIINVGLMRINIIVLEGPVFGLIDEQFDFFVSKVLISQSPADFIVIYRNRWANTDIYLGTLVLDLRFVYVFGSLSEAPACFHADRTISSLSKRLAIEGRGDT